MNIFLPCANTFSKDVHLENIDRKSISHLKNWRFETKLSCCPSFETILKLRSAYIQVAKLI